MVAPDKVELPATERVPEDVIEVAVRAPVPTVPVVLMEAAVSGPVDTVELNVAAPVEERVFDSETGPARFTAFPAAVCVKAPLKVAGPAMLTVFEAPV